MNVNLRWQAGMLFRHLLLRSVLLCGLLASCSKEEAADLSLTETDELRLGAAITGITRATDAGFEIGDTLGIFITKWQNASARDTLKESGNYTDNVLFRLEKLSNDWVAEYPVYFPSDDNKIDLYAYYPYRNPAFVSGTSLGVKVFANQSVGNHYTRSDFMTAKTLGVSRTPNKVPLIFDHRLSQMVFILKPGAGFSVADLLPARLKIINAITDATFDLRDSVPVAGSVRSDIIPAGSWTAGSESLTGMKAILIPQELNPDTYVEITLGSRRFTYRPSSVYLNPGCSRVFTITVNNTGLDITTEINPWDNCPPVNGDAYEEFDSEMIVAMTTKKLNPSFFVLKNSTISVDWGDGIVKEDFFEHNYTDGEGLYDIKFYGATDALTYLSCKNQQLTNLDVNYNTALTHLYCYNNQLTRLNLGNNTSLSFLQCYNNQLTSLDVSNNISLNHLQCSNNHLNSLDLSNNTALEVLWCNYNQLTSLDVSNNTALTYFTCVDNQLVSLDLSNNIALTFLQCKGNQLTHLNLGINTVLTELFCYENQLTNLDVSNNIALKRFYCNENQLAGLDVSKNIELMELGCSDNQLITLDISNNTSLSLLYCSNNHLNSLDLSNNTALEELKCSGNPFIIDQSALIALANSLPDRTDKSAGKLILSNSISAEWIKSICDAKNWLII